MPPWICFDKPCITRIHDGRRPSGHLTVSAQPYAQNMSWTEWVALILAAREVIPGDDADLTRILRDPQAKAVLEGGDGDGPAGQLARYVRSTISDERLRHWASVIDRVTASENTSVLVAGTDAYPPLLESCWDAPPFLFARGSTSNKPRVAIVGSRSTTDDVLQMTGRVAAAVTQAGHEVVSGLALGVDTAAHTAALQAGGTTLAVMGTGIRHVYPAENQELSVRISERGALISQFPPDAPRSSTSFLIRNHVIAGLSATSLVMAGEERSGSRNEAQAAAGYGRAVLLWEPELGARRWATSMVSGGHAKFFATPEDAVAEVGAP